MNRIRRHIGRECRLPCGSLSACSDFSEKPDWVGVRVAMENERQKSQPIHMAGLRRTGPSVIRAYKPTGEYCKESAESSRNLECLREVRKGVIRRRHMTTVAGTKECGLAKDDDWPGLYGDSGGPIRPENPSRLRLFYRSSTT